MLEEEEEEEEEEMRIKINRIMIVKQQVIYHRKYDYLFIKYIVELLLVKVDNMLKNYDKHIILI
jgi:hypothetical protein